jgi:hypothetical protein
MKGYLSETMNTLAFLSAFLKLFRRDRDSLEPIEKDFKRFSTFSIASKSKNFATFLSEIFEDCEYSFDESCKVTEEELKGSIQKKDSQMQEYFKTLIFTLETFTLLRLTISNLKTSSKRHRTVIRK